MAKTLVIHDDMENQTFRIILDGTEIKDVHRYQLIQEAAGPPLLRLEVYVLNGLEVQQQ